MSFRRAVPAVLALSIALAWAAQAQNGPPRQSPNGPPPQGMAPDMAQGRFRGPPSPVAELQKSLGLSDAQARALDGVMRHHHEQMTQLHERVESEREQIDRSTDAQVRKLLGEQRFAAFRQWMSQHRPPPPRGGMGGPDGGPGGPRGFGRGPGPASGGRGGGDWGPPPPGGRGGPEDGGADERPPPPPG